MNPGIRLRLVIFISTIAALLALIALTADVEWNRISDLHERAAAVQQESFKIADHLQQEILSLNNLVLSYAGFRDVSVWTNFMAGSQKLGGWLNQQQPISDSTKELLLLNQVRASYTNYLGAADALHRAYANNQGFFRASQLNDFENQSKALLDLGLQLSKVHQEFMESFLNRTSTTLDALRLTLLVALGLLLVAGAWLSVVVYRGMIAPLKVQLVESRQLLERQEKLASLGMLAAGVAHEIRNPLTAIKAWLFMQQRRLKAGTPEHEDANLISGEISRLERIVRDFLQFARPSEPQFAVVPADETLREVQKLLAPQLEKSNIKLALDGAEPIPIRIDAGQIKQVLINLIQNAADAIGKNGAITLRTRLDEKRLADRQTEVVILEVADSGKGIPPEVEKRLFDPFFSTKESGTGLGLPIAARIVEKHQGALQYQTHAGHGTIFGIILPRVDPAN